MCQKPILIKDGQNLSDVKRKKFCNASCSAKYNNSKRKLNKHKCIYCGKELNKKVKYCSNKCQMEYQYEEYISEWKKGRKDGLIGKYQTSGYIRRYLHEKYNSSCCECGWNKINPYTGKIPLEIEHIDGDYTNNKEENLKLLCPNCHSLTATYKGANIGNGRKHRNQYQL